MMSIMHNRFIYIKLHVVQSVPGGMNKHTGEGGRTQTQIVYMAGVSLYGICQCIWMACISLYGMC